MDTFLQTMAGIAMAMATAFIPLAALFVRQKLNLDADNATRANIETALNAAAGMAYMAGMRGVPREEAIQQGVHYLSAKALDQMVEMNISTERLTPMVEARMAKLFAPDPTIQGPQH